MSEGHSRGRVRPGVALGCGRVRSRAFRDGGTSRCACSQTCSPTNGNPRYAAEGGGSEVPEFSPPAVPPVTAASRLPRTSKPWTPTVRSPGVDSYRSSREWTRANHSAATGLSTIRVNLLGCRRTMPRLTAARLVSPAPRLQVWPRRRRSCLLTGTGRSGESRVLNWAGTGCRWTRRDRPKARRILLSTERA